MDSVTFKELAKSAQLLGNSKSVRDAIEPVKIIFDGLSTDAFAKWLWMMDDVYKELDHDDKQIIIVASIYSRFFKVALDCNNIFENSI